MKNEIISNISLEEKSHKGNVFLTFDLDWCLDEVLNYTLDKIEEKDIAATFFITHETPILERIRQNPKFELGIHPNFNFLLNGDCRYGSNYSEVIDYYLKIVPEAKSFRSHSLVQSSPILKHMMDKGLTHDCNIFIPWHSEIEVTPWSHWDIDLIRVPYIWEDDVNYVSKDKINPRELLDINYLKVFDFHPIHIFMNTYSDDFYQSYRHKQKDFEFLKNNINSKAVGVRDYFFDLIEESK